MRIPNIALGAAGLATFLALGEAVPRLGPVDAEYFSPPSRIMRRAARGTRRCRLLVGTRGHADRLGHRPGDRVGRGRPLWPAHHRCAISAPSDSVDDRVPASHSVRGTDPAGRTAVRLRTALGASAGGVRVVLAGAHSGAVRRPGRGPRRRRDGTVVRARDLGTHQACDVADGPAVRHDRNPARRGGCPGARHHGGTGHRSTRTGVADRGRPGVAGRARHVRADHGDRGPGAPDQPGGPSGGAASPGMAPVRTGETVL